MFHSVPTLQKGHLMSKDSGQRGEPRTSMHPIPTEAKPKKHLLHPHLCGLGVLLNLSLLVDSKMIFRVSNALTCLVLTGISQFIQIQGASQSDATFECVCNNGFCLGWGETANPCKRGDRPLGQMNQPHL